MKVGRLGVRGLVLAVLVVILGSGVPGGPRGAAATGTGEEPCHRAQSKCVSRVACSMALSNYMLNCGGLIHGDTNTCSTRCKKALISLLSTDDQKGEAYIHCDCNGNNFCESHKTRIEPCSRDVLPAMKAVMDESTAISCSLAELICRADTPCLTALGFYQTNCAKLMRGERCTAKCNNSLAILYRQNKARKLRNCICDGTEDYDCEALQTNTERLCFGRDHSSHNGRDHTRNGHRRHGHRGHHNSSHSSKDNPPGPRDTAGHLAGGNDTSDYSDIDAVAHIASGALGVHYKILQGMWGWGTLLVTLWTLWTSYSTLSRTLAPSHSCHHHMSISSPTC